MQNKIIIRYADGLVKKGTTQDFSTKKDVIHFKDNENGESLELSFKDLKAVFFVKDFNGNAKYQDKKNVERFGLGRKIEVQFKDGETIVGYTQGFSCDRTGFMLFHADPDSNNIKGFIIIAATDNIHFVT